MLQKNNGIKFNITEWLIVPVMGLIWLLALLYSSGIGITYDLYGKAKLITIVFFAVYLLFKTNIKLSNSLVLIVLTIILSSIITWVIYENDMLNYLWLYLLIPLISSLPIKEKPMQLVSIMYGALGMAVLFVRNFGSIFKGWNENSIAMIAFFSFAVMISAFDKPKNIFRFLWLAIYFIVYYLWSEPLNSRTGVLFSIVMTLGVLNIIPFKKWFSKKQKIKILLFVPLLVAAIIILIKDTNIIKGLENWSQQTFNKSLFNGRDELWTMGFERWLKHPLIGIGDLSANNWHNSAVTMLVGGGAIGYLIWIFGVRYFLAKGVPYLQDKIVFGLMLGFIMIWLQQSVELGLVADQANAIPYAVLGLLIGRVKTLKIN